MGLFGKKKKDEEFKTPEMIKQDQKEDFDSSEKSFKELTTGLNSEQKINVIGEMINEMYHEQIEGLSVAQLEYLKINTLPINKDGNHEDSESEE